MLLIVMTVVSAPLYVFFGWLSDRVGRKPVMVGGMLLALALYFPARTGSPARPTRRWSRRSERTPVVVDTDPATCSVQFDPVGTAKFVSACDIAKSALVTKGISYPDPALGRRPNPRRRRDRARARSPAAKACPAPTSRRSRPRPPKRSAPSCGAGYPKTADPAQINMPLLIVILLVFVVAATALYGPQAAALVEMFPTRIRYTAMSLPYHVGTGWVGGFLPVTSFAIVAITGNIYRGLWYSVVFTAMSVIVSLLFLKETAGRHLEEMLGSRAQ